MALHSDIERQLYTIFNDHPNSHVNESGEPVIPADALVDVFRSFSDISSASLLSDEEMEMLKTLLANNPGLEVTPSILLQFIAEKTRHSPSPDLHDDELQLSPRGRNQERDAPFDHHRSSSSESNDAYYHPSSGSRPPSRGPQTPFGRSPFDHDRRQRSTPLGPAPSSWGSSKRPAPAGRRRSVDGSRSDSEFSTSPSAFPRSTSGRIRTPSNPTSPTSISTDLNSFSPISSPVFSGSFSRPRSRAGSQSASAYNRNFSIFGSPGNDDNPDDDPTINNPSNFDYHDGDSFGNAISSLPMPTSALDSDSDGEEDSSLGLVLDRNTASSTASMEPLERLEALQRVNTDLGRKLMEAERTLQKRLAEHESELEEMQSKLEEMRSELSATKREEKELRSKERQNITQISALELEVAKVTKALEHAKSTYASLQRQYQEQCAASEKYRDDLRHREEVIRSLREAASLHEIEMGKWSKEQQSYEDRITHLEEELSVAQQAHAQLDEQKQENLLLKETIDRMRFEMDEMRSNAVLGLVGGGSVAGSAANTLSKSLGAELMGKMKWDEEEEEEVDGNDEIKREEDEESNVTAVEHEDEDTEDEDVIQTIITRTKRKVASRAKTIETRTFEEVKEYSDGATQYDPTLFCVSNGIQTIPSPKIPTASFATQTEPAPTRTYAAQTDIQPEAPVKVTMEMEIQTEIPEEEGQRSGSVSPPEEGEESLASSSSTIIPPTPKAHTRSLLMDEHGVPIPMDSPPTYHQAAAQRREEEEREKEKRIAGETLRRWHLGAELKSLRGRRAHTRSGKELEVEEEGDGGMLLEVDVDPIQGGVSMDLVEEWKALKEELGVECLVIDKALENSEKLPSTSATSPASASSKAVGKSRGGRFYNIYNTYVYGSSSATSSATTAKGISATLTQVATHTLLFASASAVVFIALTPYLPYLLPMQYQSVPGGASLYDRAAWASFNSLGGGGGEGIAFAAGGAGGGGGAYGVMDGAATQAVWKVLGRVGGGAVRMARGWPT